MREQEVDGGGWYGGYACQLNVPNDNASGAGGSGYVSSELTNFSTTAGEGSTTNGYAKITSYASGYQYIE